MRKMQQGSLEIIDVIRDNPCGISKRDIFPQVSLSWGGICLAVKRALEKQYIVESPAKVVARGRPCILLNIIPNAVFFVGVDIGSTSTKLVICDFNFSIRFSQIEPTPTYTEPSKFYSWLTDLIRRAIPAAIRDKVQGIGIAVSGNVDSAKGIIVSGGNFGMHYGSNIAVDEISKRLQIPCYAMNTQVASVYAEYHFGQFAKTPNIVNIGLGVGIGSGVVSDHQLLHSGARNQVGYIGHMLMPGNPYRCKNTGCNFIGCLEAFTGGNSLCAIAKARFGQEGDLTTREVDQMASAGHPGAVELLTQAAEYNSIGIATMIQMYAPDVVIFSGGQCRLNGFLYLQTLQQLLKRMPAERQNFKIGLSVLGENQGAIGAARLAYEQLLNL